jgi:hypothetical protein
MNAKFDVISGFKRIGEAEAWAVAYNRRVVEQAPTGGCDECEADKARFCWLHNKAVARMDERIEDNHVIALPVVCVES